MSDRRDFFEKLIFRSMGSERFTQNSPVLPDVWLAYGLEPDQPHELLLTPHVESNPAKLARELRKGLADHQRGPDERRPGGPRVAFNQTTVLATLWFSELVTVVLPMSSWWREYLIGGEGESVQMFRSQRDQIEAMLIHALETNDLGGSVRREGESDTMLLSADLVWLARLVGTLALAAEQPEAPDIEAVERLGGDSRLMIAALFRLLEPIDRVSASTPLWSINRNRQTEASIYRSGNTVKADAVRHLFNVRGKTVRWAVLDSGIDARHVAFRRRDRNAEPLGANRLPMKIDSRRGPHLPDDSDDVAGDGAFVRHLRTKRWINQSRIRASYDFTLIRDLLSGDPDSLDGVPEAMRERASDLGLESDLRKALLFGGAVDWELLEKMLRIPHDPRYVAPIHHHGTHVGGIIGADWRSNEHQGVPEASRTGIAPEIELYDLRVLDKDGRGNEFSIMAAMQFVRYLNSLKTGPNQMEIHGVNLSFSIRHEVANFACGRTPVCDEAERLVGSGVVVVAAAGNHGRARYYEASGDYNDGYRSISITDPGNAQGVVTVGATHNRAPHTYGVSYFSSRGPTGDGRLKPDLVAPGEKIYSTVPSQGEKDLDGTSMAAPHVSGAAALLIDRNFELVGQPARVKQILCDSATDLEREPYFQGAGMLDILRALQSV